MKECPICREPFANHNYEQYEQCRQEFEGTPRPDCLKNAMIITDEIVKGHVAEDPRCRFCKYYIECDDKFYF